MSTYAQRYHPAASIYCIVQGCCVTVDQPPSPPPLALSGREFIRSIFSDTSGITLWYVCPRSQRQVGTTLPALALLRLSLQPLCRNTGVGKYSSKRSSQGFSVCGGLFLRTVDLQVDGGEYLEMTPSSTRWLPRGDLLLLTWLRRVVKPGSVDTQKKNNTQA